MTHSTPLSLTRTSISARCLQLGILLLPALALTLNRGIGYSAALIWLSSLVFLWPWRGFAPNRNSLLIAWVFWAYPFAIALSMTFSNQWVANDFDKASRFLLILPVLFAVRQVGLTKGALFLGVTLGAIGSGLLAVDQTITGIFSAKTQIRANGFTNAIIFGDMSVLMGVMALTPLLQTLFKQQPITQHSKLQRCLVWLALPAAILGLAGGYLSETRAAIFIAPLLLAGVFFFYLNNYKQRVACVLIIAAIAGGIYIASPAAQSILNNSLLTTRNYLTENDVGREQERSLGLRMEMWKAAWIIGKNNPITGVGPDKFYEQKSLLISEGTINPVTQRFEHAHNDFLTLWAEAGAVGVLSLLFFYCALIWQCWQRRKQHPELAISGLLLCGSFALFGLSQTMLSHNLSTTFLVFIAAIIWGAIERPQH